MREEKSPSFLESSKTLLEETSDSPTLKALAQSIGITLGGPIGGILSQWVVERGEQIAKDRLEEFLTMLAEELKALEGQAVRKDYFGIPEGYDLLLKALGEARKTRSREKRELYAHIRRGATTHFEQKRYSTQEYSLLDLQFNASRIKGSTHAIRNAPRVRNRYLVRAEERSTS